jgi:hypothetical protein
MYAAIDDSFDDAGRVLRDHAQKQRAKQRGKQRSDAIG